MQSSASIDLPDELSWIPQAVENAMYRNGIESRNVLIQRSGLTKRAVYGSFNDDWSGTATGPVLARIAALLRVRMSDLVVEPASQVLRRPARRPIPSPRSGVVATG
ncbi:MAG: hypothetical protein ACRDTI_10440 [Mycobacterium sp.]